MAGLRKLLVIDGDAAMRNRVAIRMGDFFDVVQASTLKDGKASVGDVQPACIVLELNLPCQHGIATLDAVQGLFPECPIVVHTDDLVAFDQFELIRHGAQEVAVKGAGMDELHCMIETAIARHEVRSHYEQVPKITAAARAEYDVTQCKIAAVKRESGMALASK